MFSNQLGADVLPRLASEVVVCYCVDFFRECRERFQYHWIKFVDMWSFGSKVSSSGLNPYHRSR